MLTRRICFPFSIDGVRYALPPSLTHRAISRFGFERVFVFCERAGNMANAYGLKEYRGKPLPVGGSVDLILEPLRIGKVAAKAGLKPFHAHIHEKKPKFRGSEAPAELDVPVPVILDLAVLLRLQVARIGAHDADEVLRIAHIVGAEVEAHAHPFVRVKNKESARSTPAKGTRHSGRTMAVPVMAVSTWSHIP